MDSESTVPTLGDSDFEYSDRTEDEANRTAPINEIVESISTSSFNLTEISELTTNYHNQLESLSIFCLNVTEIRNQKLVDQNTAYQVDIENFRNRVNALIGTSSTLKEEKDSLQTRLDTIYQEFDTKLRVCDSSRVEFKNEIETWFFATIGSWIITVLVSVFNCVLYVSLRKRLLELPDPESDSENAEPEFFDGEEYVFVSNHEFETAEFDGFKVHYGLGNGPEEGPFLSDSDTEEVKTGQSNVVIQEESAGTSSSVNNAPERPPLDGNSNVSGNITETERPKDTEENEHGTSTDPEHEQEGIRIEKEKEEERIKKEKEAEEERIRLQKEKDAEDQRIKKEKAAEEERVRLQKERDAEEERQRKEKEAEEERIRLQKEKEAEEERLQKEKEDEKERIRLQKEKEAEEERQRKEKEDEIERIRLQKEKEAEEERIRLQKEKEAEERLQKEKEAEEERIQLEKEKAAEEERLRKEKEAEEERIQLEKEKAAEEERLRKEKEADEERIRLQKEKEAEEERARRENEEGVPGEEKPEAIDVEGIPHEDLSDSEEESQMVIGVSHVGEPDPENSVIPGIPVEKTSQFEEIEKGERKLLAQAGMLENYAEPESGFQTDFHQQVYDQTTTPGFMKVKSPNFKNAEVTDNSILKKPEKSRHKHNKTLSFSGKTQILLEDGNIAEEKLNEEDRLNDEEEEVSSGEYEDQFGTNMMDEFDEPFGGEQQTYII